MARSPHQNEALRGATRERILAAAMAGFADQGYATTTVRDIAGRAQVATGLLYQHFDSKEALLIAAFEQSMADVRGTFAMSIAAPSTDRLGTLVRAAASTIRNHLPFWKLGYASRHQPAVVMALGSALTEWTAEIVSVLTVLLREAGSPAAETDALALFAQIDGMCEHYALAPDTYPLDEVAERVIAGLTRIAK